MSRAVAGDEKDGSKSIDLRFPRPSRNIFAADREGRQSRKERQMGIISWIILGLIAGFIASKIVNKSGSGLTTDIALGVIGAIVGGYLADAVLGIGVTGVNITSILISVVGACLVLWVYHKVVART
jgi:uncharacterized membrane protein YeaQ/YmgE (transglycosylase-associated protein family)